jgi:hypothetical protein
MKKILPLLLFPLMLFMQHDSIAQCTISTTDTTIGFSPPALPCITQGSAYGEAVQVAVPATASYDVILSLTIDSVRLLSVTGLPAGITVSGSPASGVILGGGNGCLWFAGTTGTAAGNYPLTYRIRVWTAYSGASEAPFDTTLAGLGYPFSLNVCPPSQCSIDTTDSIVGLSPATLPCITPGVPYGGAAQVHIPDTGTYLGVVPLHVDSVQLLSVSGLPNGISVSGSPVSGVIPGGGNGCLWFSGTTNDTSGAYPLTFKIVIWTDQAGTSQPAVDTTLEGLGYYFALNICAGAPVATITPAGPDTICQGGSITLTAGAGTGYTYLWSDAAHSSTQSISVSASGNYHVTVYNSTDSAVSAPDTVVVGAYPGALTLSGPDTICQGDSLTLTAPQGAGYTYLWSNNATARSTTIKTPGLYTVYIYSPYHCTTIDSQMVTVHPLPVVTLSWDSLQQGYLINSYPPYSKAFFCTNDGILGFPLSGGVPSGGFYSGFYVINDSVSLPYPMAALDTIYYTYTNSNGCVGRAMDSLFLVECEGINNISGKSTISLYPNPNTGLFILQSTDAIGKQYIISDMIGRTIAQQTITSNPQNITLQNISAGPYMLEIKGSAEKAVRFMVE